MLPQAIFDAVETMAGFGIEIGDIRPMKFKLPGESLLFDRWLLLPGHRFDLSEANIHTSLFNLRMVGQVTLLGAAYCQAYEKEDSTQPAYVIANPLWGNGNEWYYFEWA